MSITLCGNIYDAMYSTAEAPMLQTVLIFQGEVNGRTNDHLSEMQDRD